MRIIICFILGTLLVSCTSNPTNKNSAEIEVTETGTSNDHKEMHLLDLFENLPGDSIKFEVDEALEHSQFPVDKTIPIYYQDYFQSIKEFDWTEQAFLLPVGKKQLTQEDVLLVVAEHYDYGVKYWGIKYNTPDDSILGYLILARTFNDAEASEEITSIVNVNTHIERTITTCIAEVDWEVNPIKILSENCTDTIKVYSLKNLELINTKYNRSYKITTLNEH